MSVCICIAYLSVCVCVCVCVCVKKSAESQNDCRCQHFSSIFKGTLHIPTHTHAHTSRQVAEWCLISPPWFFNILSAADFQREVRHNDDCLICPLSSADSGQTQREICSYFAKFQIRYFKVAFF